MSTATHTLTVTFTVREDSSDDHPRGFTETEVTAANIDGVPVTATTDSLLERVIYQMVTETEAQK